MHWSLTHFFRYFFKIILIFLFFILIFLFPTKNIIYSIGSTTVLPLMEKLGNNYYNKTGTKVAIAGGGSTVGVNMMLKGLTDIGNASRNPKEEEYKDSLWETKKISTFPIAYDGILIIVNLGTKEIEADLLISQLISIYEGKITNWQEVAPKFPNLKITLFNRESGSGTLDSFSNALKEYQNGENINFSPDSNVINSNTQMINMLENTPGAIGYAQLAYLNQIYNSSKLSLFNLYGNNGEPIFEPKKFKTILSLRENLETKIYDSIIDPKTVKDHYLFWHPLNLIISTNINSYKFQTIKKYIDYIFSEKSTQNIKYYLYLPIVLEKSNSYELKYPLSDDEKKIYNKCLDNGKTLTCIAKLFTDHQDLNSKDPDNERKPIWYHE